jgi:hypothetical protein
MVKPSPRTTAALDRHVNIMARIAALSRDQTAIMPVDNN